jgi:hypothetical protein
MSNSTSTANYSTPATGFHCANCGAAANASDGGLHIEGKLLCLACQPANSAPVVPGAAVKPNAPISFANRVASQVETEFATQLESLGLVSTQSPNAYGAKWVNEFVSFEISKTWNGGRFGSYSGSKVTFSVDPKSSDVRKYRSHLETYHNEPTRAANVRNRMIKVLAILKEKMEQVRSIEAQKRNARSAAQVAEEALTALLSSNFEGLEGGVYNNTRSGSTIPEFTVTLRKGNYENDTIKATVTAKMVAENMPAFTFVAAGKRCTFAQFKSLVALLLSFE